MASPLLMLPILEETRQKTNPLSSLRSLCKSKKSYNLNILENPSNFNCIGSSHAWLAFLNEEGNPFLLNPFSQTLIHLPPKKTLPHVEKSPYKICKLILSENPSSKSKPQSYTAVAMYTIGFGTKIAFCKDRDNAWRSLASEGKEKYYDVVFRPKSNTLLVLRSGPGVDSWDLSRADSPRKTTIIQDSCTRALKLVDQTFPEDLYTSRWYLALSPAGEVLVIGRYVGEFVRHDGEVVREEDTLTDLAAEPLICPYKTLGFCVLMVSEDGREWVEVKSLGDFVLFLGGNESLMASSIEHKELKKNSIYFTDDYWERVDEDYNYGGHDMGVFDIGDGRIQPLLEFHQRNLCHLLSGLLYDHR